MNVRDLLSDKSLQQKKLLEKLLCHYTGLTKEQLITSYDQELTPGDVLNIKTWYDAYTKDKKPLEFIMWYVEFFQRKFKVDSRCLIPRPETEYMIEGVNEHIKLGITNYELQDSDNVLIDVWTWCWVLWLSVLLENPGFFTKAYLTEYYPETLSLAKENYEHYKSDLWDKTDITLIQANLIDFVQHDSSLRNSKFIIVANLPYIPDETFDTQAEDNVRKREPRPAFVGGKDGLDFYREMFAQIFTLRNNIISSEVEKSFSCTMFLEMMTRQVDILRQEFGDKIDFEEIKTFHFNIRIVKGTVKNTIQY
jgi:release factor glutamine methyltransferase